MGTAIEFPRDQKSPHEPHSNENIASAASLAGAGSVKWRVAERLVPSTCRDMPMRVLTAIESHPLTLHASRQGQSSLAPKTDESYLRDADVVDNRKHGDEPQESEKNGFDHSNSWNEKKSTEKKENSNPELVILQDGDIDPLGVLSMGTEAVSSSALYEQQSFKPSQKGLLVSAVGSTGSVNASSSITRPEKANAPQTVKHLWKTHTDRVLAKFSEHTFKINASMLEVNDLENEISWTSTSEYKKQQEGAVDGISVIKKTRERLEQLERRTSDSSAVTSSSSSTGSKNDDKLIVEMSQSEYIAKIRAMEKELVAAWNANQKVAALRIAIKCVKLLADTTSSSKLYPCVYVLVSDVLDCFGNLVFERIKTRASEDENGQPLPTPLSENFTSTDVNIQAKETCRNWFYKTACIRELLPRIYIEIALIKCYRFLCDEEYPQIVARLSNMIKGVGEPMVALYTRLYLALSSTELLHSTDITAVLSSMYDYFFTFNQFQLNKLEKWLTTQNMELSEYLGLHSPAVEWLMKCAADGGNQDTFESLLDHYREFSDNSMVLKHLCESFGPQYYATQPLTILHLMRTSGPSQFTKCHLYSLLALQLSSSSTLTTTKEGKLQFLNEAWGSITSQEDIAQYMECAAAYMKLIVAHFSHREALILLKDVVRHLNSATPDELTPKVYNLLGAVIENVVYGAQRHFEFFSNLIPSNEFLTLMGMFRREASVSVAKKVLQTFVGAEITKGARHSRNMRLHVVGTEAAVAHTLFVICCRVHDALDSLSTAAERADATKDICAFILRLGYVDTLHSETKTDSAQDDEQEALLMLYIDCRSAFYKLEHVKATLAKQALRLAMHVHKRIQYGATGSKKRLKNHRNFIKSCLAYAHITIPSILDSMKKLELLVLSAKIALINNCIPQMDAFLKAALILISELDASKFQHAGAKNEESDLDFADMIETDLQGRYSTDFNGFVRIVAELTGILVYAPSLNDDDAFYFVNGLHKAVFERMLWPQTTSMSIQRLQLAVNNTRVQILLFLVQLYGLWGQKKLPPHFLGVDSNDVLYGGQDGFYADVQRYFSSTIEEILRVIETMSELPQEADNSMTSKSKVPLQTLVLQVELMLDFINQIVPFLDYDEAQTPSPTNEELNLSTGGSSRRRKRPRSGATLVRKCLIFSHTQLTTLVTTATGDENIETRKQVNWIEDYYANTHQYVVDYLPMLRKLGRPINENSKRDMNALEEVLPNLLLR